MSEYVPDYVWAFVLALVITFALTPLVKRFAVAVGALINLMLVKCIMVLFPVLVDWLFSLVI